MFINLKKVFAQQQYSGYKDVHAAQYIKQHLYQQTIPEWWLEQKRKFWGKENFITYHCRIYMRL